MLKILEHDYISWNYPIAYTELLSRYIIDLVCNKLNHVLIWFYYMARTNPAI